jgi:GTP cyclohydrolase I
LEPIGAGPIWQTDSYLAIRRRFQTRRTARAHDRGARDHGGAMADAGYLEAHPLCVEMRGGREFSPLTRTSFWRGAYEEDPALGDEFFVSCGLPR